MRSESIFAGWRAAVLVAATYVYFLIFAQFAFLARLSALGMPAAALQPVMGAMAAGGILFSFAAARLMERLGAVLLLRAGFALCGIAAACTAASWAAWAAVPIALCIGAGLGIVTVSLVTHLRSWCGERYPLLSVGLGTGLGYLLCNVPALFNADPRTQALAAVAFCIAGFAVAATPRAQPDDAPIPAMQAPFPLVLASFAALVWLDSAAFYIIQHTAALKAASWSGPAHLWSIGFIHLVVALVAAYLLRARATSIVLCIAVATLGAACLLLARPTGVFAASLLYPAGVSLYSVALVAYPGFLSGAATLRQRANRAAWLYAIAGWVGSAMGIGMAQHLGHVPAAFVLCATAVVFAPLLFGLLRTRTRELALLAATLLAALALQRALPAASAHRALSAAERGRRVYISEGCISCHSQYVRPGTSDEILWGPAKPLAVVHAERPPLIGNRRQGPDLAEVGTRRSAFWLRAHLIDPAALSDRSVMPSYAFLFNDGRGDDLVAYLASLHAVSPEHTQQQAAWHLDSAAMASASSAEGMRLYERHCATCHEADGVARVRWPSGFLKAPPDLRTLATAARVHSQDQLAHVVRFGIPGTSMPGHEYLSDTEIASIVHWLANPSAQLASADAQPSGDHP